MAKQNLKIKNRSRFLLYERVFAKNAENFRNWDCYFYRGSEAAAERLADKFDDVHVRALMGAPLSPPYALC